jgi:hypothetical protein
MFARKVAARLKPNSLTEFKILMEYEILPWLREQKGFLDLIVLAAADGTEVAALSFWDRKEDAQAYNSHGYPDVLSTLGNLFDGVPYVKTFDVLGSTLQSIAMLSRPEAGDLIKENSASESEYRSCETQF